MTSKLMVLINKKMMMITVSLSLFPLTSRILLTDQLDSLQSKPNFHLLQMMIRLMKMSRIIMIRMKNLFKKTITKEVTD